MYEKETFRHEYQSIHCRWIHFIHSIDSLLHWYSISDNHLTIHQFDSFIQYNDVQFDYKSNEGYSVHYYALSSDYKPWLLRNIEDNHTFHSWCTSSWFPWTHIRTLQPWTNSVSLFPIHSFLLEIISTLFDICYHCEFGCICSFASH